MINKLQNINKDNQLKMIGIGLVIYLIGFYSFEINPSFTASINNMLGLGG